MPHSVKAVRGVITGGVVSVVGGFTATLQEQVCFVAKNIWSSLEYRCR